MHPGLERQIELENEMRGMGIARFRQELQAARERGNESSTSAVLVLMKTAFTPLENEIKGWMDGCSKGKAGNNNNIYKILKDLDPSILAFLTLKAVFDNISVSQEYTKICVNLGRLIEDEQNFQLFRENNEKLFNRVVDDLSKRTNNYAQKRTVLKFAAKKDMTDLISFPNSDRFKIGATLIQMMKEVTGFINVERRKTANGKDAGHIMYPTEKTMEWLRKQNARCEVLSPNIMPCIIPPKPWTTPTDGGFYAGIFRIPIVKTRNMNYLEELNNVDMWEVYQALNHMQNTPWSVNKELYGFLKAAVESGQSWANLPTGAGSPIPPKPEDIDTNVEARRSWKKQATTIHNENIRVFTKFIALQKKLQVAERFMDEDAMYFVYNLDFRGRAYPVQLHLTPQGDDICKGLLKFKEGKPLDTQGANWLAIHGANTYGYDKADFQGRIDWVFENEDEIIASATDPFSNKFWTKADKPWTFLAFCLEWKGYTADPDNFLSHIAVGMDGSCNGLQNFSAMLRDPIGGAATNLIPADHPQDIYQKVADVVKGLVELDVEAGVTEAAPWVGFINRKLAKRPTMTMPYGATLIGMKDQISAEIKDWKDKGLPCPLFEGSGQKECMYMAKVIQRSLGMVVVSAAQAMGWLQKVAKIVAKENLPIRWSTPVGFPVLQDYRRPNLKRVNTVLHGGLRIQQTIAEGMSTKLDTKRMESGISPNFVHSIDAAHMIRTVNLCIENNIDSLQMIHDSFASHAADASALFQIIRHAFVQIHTEVDAIQDFEEIIKSQLTEELGKTLPQPPKRGVLNLDGVLDSQYFFA